MARADSPRRRWHITSRVFAAVLLGYLLANSIGLIISMVLTPDPITGIVAGTMSTFATWCAVAMWAFAVERTRTVWLVLLGAVAVTGTIAVTAYFLNGGVS
ncbi:MAG: hypothetical protein AAGE43_02975 [Pseudomonadota bacterium]